MTTPRLTVIVPTMNRADLLVRLLDYYADAGFRHRIAVGDSSNAANVEVARAALARIGSRLDVSYTVYPGVSCHSTQKDLIRAAESPYIVSLPDDDFLVPAALDECIDFLDTHPDYIAAHGLGLLLTRDSEAPFRAELKYYPQPIIEAETPQQRLLDLLADYSVPAFAVHRREAFVAMWATEIADFSFGELLPCCISAVMGKIKQLDSLSLVRQMHDRRYLSPDFFDRVTSAGWRDSYDVFRDSLAVVLSERAGIPAGEAALVVKRGFWSYLSRAIASPDPSLAMDRDGSAATANGSGSRSRLRLILRSIRHTHRHGGGMSGIWLALPVVLKSGTRYHDEFLPIYRAIVGEADAA